MDISVVIPCLNEEQTVGGCVHTAKNAIARMRIIGEVLVVDNGSSDRSIPEARKAGGRIITCTVKGYGAALRKGINQAKGRWIVIGDADNTYDFNEIPKLTALLEEGADFVMGSRITGKIHEQAMPWLHRWVGTPFLTTLVNFFFKCDITDVNCGFRAFTRDAVRLMNLQSNGMEFATEMVIKAANLRMRIKETPIHYHPPIKGRVSKLKTLRDGWRHFRYVMASAR